MDRKAWIIIAVCAAILGINFYFSPKEKQPPTPPPAPAQTESAKTTEPSATSTPSVTSNTGKLPSLEVTTPNSEIKPKEFVLKNNSAKFVFSNIGGGLKYAEINGQKEYYGDNLLRVNSTSSVGIGTIVSDINPSSTPGIDSVEYIKVDSDSNDKTLVLLGRMNNGLVVRKEFRLLPTTGTNPKTNKEYPVGNDYLLSLSLTIENPTDKSIRQPALGLFAGLAAPIHHGEDSYYTNYFYRADGSFTSNTASHFEGGFFSSSKSREIHAEKDLEYAGVMNQFFASMIIPTGNTHPEMVYAEPRGVKVPSSKGATESKGVMVAMGLPVVDLGPKASTTFTYEIFVGPKLNSMLADIPVDRPGWFRDIMAYGWLTFLSVPLNWLLNFMHSWMGNWGLAIIGMTIVVRILIWPLHNKSYRSMKRMAQMQPKVAELKKKFGDNPQKLNMETMKLYKKYGVNPVSGCFPMLIQIPIFFAFYRVLQYSTEMRGQPFFGWIHDLSRPDTIYSFDLPFSIPFIGSEIPINILPVLMGVSMVFQMRMTPQAGDKLQQRIMNFMPLMFFAFCYNFASALALYWTVQNIISMGQTLLMKKLPEPTLKENTKEKKPGFFAKLLEQQQQAIEEKQKTMRNVTPPKKKN